MKPAQPLLWLALLGYAALGHADDWGSFATTSNTSPGFLCDITDDGRDLDCVAPNPEVLTGGVVSATGVSVSGVVTASAFVGDGSGLTNISGSTINALDDIGDVNASSPGSGQVLSWSGSAWSPSSIGQTCVADTSNDITEAMTATTTNGHTVTQSSAYSNHDNYKGWRAFDDELQSPTKWQTNNTTSGWLVYQFPSAQTVVGYAITGRSSQSPNAWTFDGSNNGSSWTTLDTQSGETGWGSSSTRTYLFSNSTAYAYYRINISSNNGASFTEIEEAAFYGVSCTTNGDNLGNHTASQTLVMDGNDITGAGEVFATGVSVSGVVSATTIKVSGQDGTGCSTAADIGRIQFNPVTQKFQLCRP